MGLNCFVLILLSAQIFALEDSKLTSDVEFINQDNGTSNQEPSDAQAENPNLPPAPAPQSPTMPSPESGTGEEVGEPARPAVVPEDKPPQDNLVVRKGKSGKLIYNYPTDYDPMTSRYAPWQDSQRGGTGIPYAITEARLKQIREPLMYPYFDLGGTADNEGDYQRAIQASTSQIHKNLNFQLPFFGFRFNYTRVSMNGYLEFSDPPENMPDYPLVFPIKDWPKKNDPSFIGIYYSRCRIGALRAEDVDKRRPGVYFRLERDLRNRIDQMGVEIRERLKWDIREGVIGAEAFDPKHAIIVTWKNISFAGGISNSLYTTNTYQMVLATDEVLTYAMFNYLNLEWTTHTEAGGDTLKGEGGIPAYVGFNAGNGTRSYEYLPYSQNSIIRDLTEKGFGNGKHGRHYFRIDENILPGTCNKDIDGANLDLVFAPESGNMLGGTIVNITGPCFEITDRITCKFDIADEVVGVVVDRNRALCVQPRLYVEGYVNLEISIAAGKYKWKGKYFVEPAASAAQKIFFSDMSYNEKNPPEFKISWVKQNLTNNDNANVRISLWGYRESTIRPEFVYITTLAENAQNNGEFVIVPSQYRNRENPYQIDMKFGFIQINLTESMTVGVNNYKQQITPKIWSRPIPLAWYFGPQWERLYGKKWPQQLCDIWLTNDRYLKNFAHELPQCPCTLEHALADKGRFMPDFDCDKDSNPRCYYHRTAVHCVRSGSPSMEGAEQQCCYDRLGYLMLSYDQQWGSSPARSHHLGYVPWNEATKVPTLSQWYHDMVPKFVCCLWQDEQAVGCETLRFERRPSQDCVAYQAPGVAGVFGDPHIITFDDVAYTFNGKGEFVLLRSAKKALDVQGRFEQMPMSEYGEVRATQLTSVVAKGNSTTVVEVRIRPKEAQWRYRLDVIANGKRVYFDRPSLKFQHFPGVTVYTPTYTLNQSEVIMMFDSGAGVEVLENKGYMSTRIYLPWTFINETRGLLGNWSFDQQDDFTLPDGTKSAIVAENANDFERIYKDFGVKWMLSDNDDPLKGRALFYREYGKSSATYNNKSFIPEFRMKPEELIPSNRSQYIKKAYKYCPATNNYQCLYDYSVTLDRDLAHFTSNYKASITTLKEISRKRIISCGVLETPRFGRKSNFFFTPGTKVMFECNENFILVGDQRRECLPDGNWNVPEYGYAECLRQQEYSSQQAGKTGGIIVAILLPIILLIAYLAFLAYKGYTRTDSSSWQYNGNLLRHNSKLRLSERSLSPNSENPTSTSPEFSVNSGSIGQLLPKKKIYYDKSYRTHEPLKGRSPSEFEDKPLDPNDSDYDPKDFVSPPASVIYTEPFSHSKPDLVNVGSRSPTTRMRPVSYTSDNYAKPFKNRMSSQSSIITDV